MSNLFFLKKQDRAISSNRLVIKAADYQKIVHGEKVIDQARQWARKKVLEAKAQYRQEKQKGYTDGVEQARAEISEQIMATSIAASQYITGLEQRLIELVMEVVKKILGQINEDELICKLAEKALETVCNEKHITICVHPSAVDNVKATITKFKEKMPGIDILEVRSEPRLEQDGCILESEMGYVNGSLGVQLKVIQDVFEREIEKRRQHCS